MLLLASCATTASPKKQEAYHFQMGLAYLQEDNPTGALTEFLAAEKLEGDNAELANYFGIAYFRKNRFDLAEQKYLKAISLKPDYSEARNNLAVTYLGMKRWDDAIKQLKIVTSDLLYPDQLIANINLSLAWLGKGDSDKALDILRPMLDTYPMDPRVRFYLGNVYTTINKPDLAIDEYRKAIELSSDYAQAHYNLALELLKNGDKKGAAAEFKEVIRILPDSDLGQISREKLDALK